MLLSCRTDFACRTDSASRQHVLITDTQRLPAQKVKGVKPIEEGINPATWMLEQSTVGQEARLGVNFAAIYKDSEFARHALLAAYAAAACA